MLQNNPINVAAAFEILLEEIETEIDFRNRVGSQSIESSDYKRAREALELAEQLTALKDKLAKLQREWYRLVPFEDKEAEDTETTESRRTIGRLRRGLRTPEEAYFRPILRVLERLGGAGRVSEVLDGVGEEMKDILREVDFELLASLPHTPRWRNAAQWARNSMVHEGLIKSDSPRGIWEITEKGRESLKGKA